jgi:hypothetical protein
MELRVASRDNDQLKMFREWFFSTVQIVFAGSDSEGLSYGASSVNASY